MRRTHVLVLAGALAACLIAASPPRLVGDGREYLAQAINFASFHGPAIRPPDIPAIQSQLVRFDPALAGWDLWAATAADRNRGRHFSHFWFYALLAAPALWLTNAAGMPATLAFTALNVTLLGLALWVVLPRIGPAGSLLLFAGPIVWWIDKAHTEVFTFALLTIAFASLEDQPWWAMLAAGVAATQNPPVAVVTGLVWIAAVMHDRSALIDRRVVAGAAAGFALACLHPVYTYVHFHTPSLLLAATRSGMPSLASLTSVVIDPTIGLTGNFPVFLAVVAVSLAVLAARRDREGLARGTIVAAIAAAVFLFSFSRTTNVHHGGTPSVSRYALWLIPLAVPLLSAMQRIATRSWRRFLWAAAVVSAVISVAAFRPSVPQNSREPTWLATFLWTRLPGWNNPLPEVFSETLLHDDDLWVPVSTPGCEKVLVAARDDGEADWPIPCYPAALSAACRHARAMCYANLAKHGYSFTRAAGEAPKGKVRSDAVWPADAVPHVRRLFDAWNWRAFHFGSDRVLALQHATGVEVASLGSDDRCILVLTRMRTGARLRLRPNAPMSGILVDAITGRTIAAENYDPRSGDVWDLDVPNGFDILLLALRRDDLK